MRFLVENLQHTSFPFEEALCVIFDFSKESGDEQKLLKAALERLLDFCAEIDEQVENHPDLDDGEPWFGFAWRLADGKVWSEAEVFSAARKHVHFLPQIEKFVELVIAYNDRLGGDPEFMVNEELEAGAYALESLLSVDSSRYLPLYLRFLKSFDMEHTVRQLDYVRQLKESLSETNFTKLSDFIRRQADCGLLREVLGLERA